MINIPGDLKFLDSVDALIRLVKSCNAN
jgi:hypothetical protein